MKKILISLVAAGLVSSAYAAPVIFEIDGAKVIVSRPVDSWSGHKASAQYLLDCIGVPKIAYFYINDEGKKKGGASGLWVKKEQNELVANIDALLEKSGYSAMGDSGCSISVDRPITIQANEVQHFLKAQNSLYRTYVLNQGDPSTLTARTTAKRYIGAVFSFAMMGVGIDRLSHLGDTGVAFATSLGQDISLLSAPSRKGLAPLPLENIDLSGYQTVDVRTIHSPPGDRVGQIVIAYVGGRDTAIENRALAQAIVTAAGGNATKQAVEASREQDYQKRLQLWAECVAAGQCKP